MADEFFNLDDELVDFAEMNGFDFVSGKYITNSEYSEQPYTFKYGTFDLLDIIKNVFQGETHLQNQR